MGSLFEQSLLLFLDITVMELMARKATNSDAMFQLHANLE
jgi:6-phospho-3-hexuloisomerase